MGLRRRHHDPALWLASHSAWQRGTGASLLKESSPAEVVSLGEDGGDAEAHLEQMSRIDA